MHLFQGTLCKTNSSNINHNNIQLQFINIFKYSYIILSCFILYYNNCTLQIYALFVCDKLIN